MEVSIYTHKENVKNKTKKQTILKLCEWAIEFQLSFEKNFKWYSKRAVSEQFSQSEIKTVGSEKLLCESKSASSTKKGIMSNLCVKTLNKIVS